MGKCQHGPGRPAERLPQAQATCSEGQRKTAISRGSMDFYKKPMFKDILLDTQITSTYLQDYKSLILMPKKVEYYASMNGKDFFLLDTINNDIDPKDEKVQTKDFTTEILPTEARYLKVKAYYYGKLPGWKPKTGGETYFL